MGNVARQWSKKYGYNISVGKPLARSAGGDRYRRIQFGWI
jgi:hypothetical protein